MLTMTQICAIINLAQICVMNVTGGIMMNTYISKFRQYVAENSPDNEIERIGALLELLGVHYRARNPIDIEELRDRFCSLEPILKSLSKKRERRLLRIMVDACDEYQCAAFQEGIRVGAQLVMELCKDTLY